MLNCSEIVKTARTGMSSLNGLACLFSFLTQFPQCSKSLLFCLVAQEA